MKLPQFIYEKVKMHRTSLGDNQVFPPEEEYCFDYEILKTRFHDVLEAFNYYHEYNNFTSEEIISELSKLINKCKNIEKQYETQLVAICKNIVIEMFDIPAETLEIQCNLVEKIEPKHPFRLYPNSKSIRNFDFDDLKDFDNVQKVILKRRFINSLILGGAYDLSETSLFIEELKNIAESNELLELYDKIRVLNDYLLFTVQEKISDKHPMQGACVEVELGSADNKTLINAQGIIFPFLLNETIRGCFELFASHGLPDDNEKAEYILGQADFLIAEPWDLRFGVKLWEIVSKGIDKSEIIPFYFSNLCQLPCDEFNEKVREILAQTKLGKQFQKEFIENANDDYEYNSFELQVQAKDNEELLIADEFMNETDIDNMVFEEDENGESNYESIILNADYSDIDFNDYDGNINGIPTSKQRYILKPLINGVEIPTELVYLRCEEVIVGKIHSFQLHIYINESLRRNGIATKIYRAFINHNGDACTLFSNWKDTAEHYFGIESESVGAIERLWHTLEQFPEIKVYPIMNGDNVVGYFATKDF